MSYGSKSDYFQLIKMQILLSGPGLIRTNTVKEKLGPPCHWEIPLAGLIDKLPMWQQLWVTCRCLCHQGPVSRKMVFPQTRGGDDSHKELTTLTPHICSSHSYENLMLPLIWQEAELRRKCKQWGVAVNTDEAWLAHKDQICGYGRQRLRWKKNWMKQSKDTNFQCKINNY